MAVTHGTASTYRSRHYKCRCADCTAAHHERTKREREIRIQRLADNPTLVKHGSAATYNNWGCRCEACTDAHTKRCRDYKASRKAAA